MSLRERIENWLRDYEYAVRFTKWEAEPFMEDAAELLYEVAEKWEDEFDD